MQKSTLAVTLGPFGRGGHNRSRSRKTQMKRQALQTEARNTISPAKSHQVLIGKMVRGAGFEPATSCV